MKRNIAFHLRGRKVFFQGSSAHRKGGGKGKAATEQRGGRFGTTFGKNQQGGRRSGIEEGQTKSEEGESRTKAERTLF